MACDMGHVTCYTWWGVNILLNLQVPNSYGLGKNSVLKVGRKRMNH